MANSARLQAEAVISHLYLAGYGKQKVHRVCICSFNHSKVIKKTWTEEPDTHPSKAWFYRLTKG